MKQKGLIVSSDNSLSSYKDLSDIEFVIIRLGFTDFNTKKTRHIDSKFYENYELSKKENLKIGLYYESRAVTIDEAKDEIEYFLHLLKNKTFDYPIIIEYEDNHNTIIYHPSSQKNISKNMFLKIINYEVNELKKSGYDVIIKTYESWYKNIFIKNVENVKYFLDDNKEYFDGILYKENDTVINNLDCKNVKIELSVRENNLLLKIKKYIKAGYKIIKKKVGK